ncbi:hypothetical protein [Psychromonas algicola]|uniref:hypothetical protein n=1 Tax=Psychromonas algicola TaxID=2555642 RepID=UPI001067AFEA|nr:hypothetical protein [Psychromonas sp. RZ5]TEW50156.1 hypothetical protein E2R67_09835 [Psychromonas sp. RZ5]
MNSPHEYTFKLDEHACLNNVFTYLAKKRYLPKVQGNGHSWDATFDNENVVHFIANQQTPEQSELLTLPISRFAGEGIVAVFFSYYSGNKQ